MNEEQLYLALELALLGIDQGDDDPNGHFQHFLSRMDVIPNGFKYGIWESEDPSLTLAWRNHVAKDGVSQFDWGYKTAMSFLDSLGRLGIARPNGLYEEDRLRESDAKWGVDLEAKAARLKGRLISSASSWSLNCKRFLAQETIREFLWLKSNLNAGHEDKDTVENKEDAFIEYFGSNADGTDNPFQVLLAFLKGKDHRLAAHVGKVAFGLLSDNWFWFDRRDGKGILRPAITTPLEMQRQLETDLSFPMIALAIVSGFTLEFGFADSVFEVVYPHDGDTAELWENIGGKKTRLHYGTIDGFLTTARFHRGESGKGLNLLKAIRESHGLKVLA